MSQRNDIILNGWYTRTSSKLLKVKWKQIIKGERISDRDWYVLD